MKKTLAVLTAVVMVSIVLVAGASGAKLDLKAMTDDELLKLHDDLIAELFAREKSASVSIGEYVIGEHLPAGEYKISISASKGLAMATVSTYKGTDALPDQMFMLFGESNEIGRIVLKDGMRLEISGGGVTITPLLGGVITFK